MSNAEIMAGAGLEWLFCVGSVPVGDESSADLAILLTWDDLRLIEFTRLGAVWAPAQSDVLTGQAFMQVQPVGRLDDLDLGAVLDLEVEG